MSNIVIAGSGFAACTAVRTLRKNGFHDCITMVSPRAELFYYPSLIRVADGGRKEADLRVCLDGFCRRHGVNHVAASVTGLDSHNRALDTSRGKLEYDYLLIASGGRYIRKLPGLELAHIACAGWQETNSWAQKLNSMSSGSLAFGFASNPNEPSAMRGGPVFEFLFGTDTLLRRQGRRNRFELHFFSPAAKPGARMGDKAVERILGEMQRRHITIHAGHKMKRFEAGRVVTDGEEFAGDLILFVPGMTGPDWASNSGLALSAGGFFQATEHCRVAGSERVYVAGDAGSFPGPDWKPKQAHMADLQAEAAAKNILNQIAGREDDHTFKTELICIIDTLDTGTMVYRDCQRMFQLKARPFHWAKSWFEWRYLRPYR